MKGRRSTEGRGGVPTPAELSLVCFPTRSNLSIMPNKPICSPGHRGETTTRQHHHHRNINRGGRASPLFWSKTKPTSEMNEPTSPKVNCAGNIKVTRPTKITNSTTTSSTSSSKNWHSVMQEQIERIQDSKKVLKNQRQSNSSTRVMKKDIIQFLTGGLKNIRSNLRKRFSTIAAAGSDITSSSSVDHEDITEEEEDQEVFKQNRSSFSSARTSFSKWFTILQECKNTSTNTVLMKNEESHEEETEIGDGFSADDDEEEINSSPPPPPPNALLLMRRRSLPAQCRFQEKEEEEETEKAELVSEEEKKMERLLLKCYTHPPPPEFIRVSSHNNNNNNLEKKTWVVGGIKDPFSRSQSWRS